MDAAPLLARIAAVLERHRLEAIVIGNAAAALNGARAQRVRFGDASVLVASLADIIKSEKAAGRPQDLAVLDILQKTFDEATSRLLALPPEKRTHFLRKRIGIRMSAL